MYPAGGTKVSQSHLWVLVLTINGSWSKPCGNKRCKGYEDSKLKTSSERE